MKQIKDFLTFGFWVFGFLMMIAGLLGANASMVSIGLVVTVSPIFVA